MPCSLLAARRLAACSARVKALQVSSDEEGAISSPAQARRNILRGGWRATCEEQIASLHAPIDETAGRRSRFGPPRVPRAPGREFERQGRLWHRCAAGGCFFRKGMECPDDASAAPPHLLAGPIPVQRVSDFSRMRVSRFGFFPLYGKLNLPTFEPSSWRAFPMIRFVYRFGGGL